MGKNTANNVLDVMGRMKQAASRAGRNPGCVRLLAATKNRSPRHIQEAIEAGVKVVGENRVQEMIEKRPHVCGPVEWHFIGHLQRNKVKDVVGEVSLIHSVDSIRLAREIDRRASLSGVDQQVLLQVNVAGESSKYGFEIERMAETVDSLVGLDNLSVVGLSTVAPMVEDPAEVRWVFRDLKALSGELRDSRGFLGRELSMGMTNDFEVAIEEGSTLVRIGTALFGPVMNR